MSKKKNQHFFGLIGDIGGTNARFALWRGNGPEKIQILSCRNYTTLEEAILAYLGQQLGVHDIKPSMASLAVAGPVTDDHVNLTNLGWNFSIEEMRRDLGFDHFEVFNDFRALALSLPHLGAKDLFKVGPEENEAEQGPKLVLGPGTGLGVAGLVPCDSRWIAVPGEGGHVSFSPETEQEDRILTWFRRKVGGRVSVERLICGPGLEMLYRAMCDLEGWQPQFNTAREITEAALANAPNERVCLDMFCGMLGSLAGDLALVYNAFGGVYIGGGIIPRMLDFFAESSFRLRFEDKGRMTPLTSSMPTWVITHPMPALTGAIAAIQDLPRPTTPGGLL
ncbi:glucokinase [Acanthopleuribacter pedis]|uniref:Glucokinase n=1 Tax=Acanthopleuribacter pedis TaxID=442870 RepID=A0A8J7U0W6_9BACT|nr:glucokinase [Acanthopleuribacter pedis]MBO1317523.1 glucokinase [Acanthopleuribacter pedis]